MVEDRGGRFVEDKMVKIDPHGGWAGNPLEEEFGLGRPPGVSPERLHRSEVHEEISGIRGTGRRGVRNPRSF